VGDSGGKPGKDAGYVADTEAFKLAEDADASDKL
jgi:hypothetical protein